MEDNEIINRVANSSLVTFDLEKFYQPGERELIDIKDQLYQGLILKERDFRDFVKQHDWKQYENKFVAITCSADAIVPIWAFMLISIALQPYAKKIIFGTLEDLETALFNEKLSEIDWTQFADAKVVVKGCSKIFVPVAVYVEATNRLKSFVSSLSFGEPCSTVPLFKMKKA